MDGTDRQPWTVFICFDDFFKIDIRMWNTYVIKDVLIIMHFVMKDMLIIMHFYRVCLQLKLNWKGDKQGLNTNIILDYHPDVFASVIGSVFDRKEKRRFNLRLTVQSLKSYRGIFITASTPHLDNI